MMRIIMKSKIHNATVTEAGVDYGGSVRIDIGIMEEADIVEGERVQIVNLNNGERLETYAIAGERSSGVIGMNGPAALKCRKGDKVHIISYVMADDEERKDISEKVIKLDESNVIRGEDLVEGD